MNKEKAKQILQDIKNECNKNVKREGTGCSGCHFYIGNSFNSYCVFSAEDDENNYDGVPKDWVIDAMPNLK